MQYRWGLVGIVLAFGFFAWYQVTSGENRQINRGEATKNLEKIVCPRCQNDPEKKTTCSLCGGLGFLWVDASKDPGREQPAK